MSTADWTELLSDGKDGDLSRVTALVGAGVSVDAGLPVAYELIDELVRCLVRHKWAADELMRLARAPRRDMRDEHDFIRFETLLLWIGRVFDPQLDLFSFLTAFTVPDDLHRRLAHATRRGLRLVTVNFDDLLERALLEQGAEPQTVDVQGPAPDELAGVPIYKLHGTRMRHAAGVATADTRALLATTEVIAAAHPGTFLNNHAARTLSSLVDGRTLLVAGYSASDDLDVVPTLAAARPARVVWIDHRDASARREGMPSERSRLPWRRLLAAMADAGAEVVPVVGRTDEVFERLGLGLAAGSGARRGPSARWRPAVRHWARGVRAHDPAGLGLAALLFGELGRYDLNERALGESRPSRLPDGRWTAARRTYEQGQAALLREPGDPRQAYALARRARQQATRPADARTAVLAELLLGRAAFMQQQYRRAASHFGTAEQATLPGSMERAHALGWQGRAQVWDGRPKLGLSYLRRAATAFRQRGELEGLLDALEASAVAQLALMRIADARGALVEAHGLAHALGYVDRRFTTACNMAEAELLVGNASEADRRVRSALRGVGDETRDEVADGWTVLAQASLELGRFRAAGRAAGRAIQTTTSVNRNLLLEHLCDLAEAQHLAGASHAAGRTLQAASACTDDEVTLLGRARLMSLEAARCPSGSRSRIATSNLLPAAIVRLADTQRRVGLAAPEFDRTARQAHELRMAAFAGEKLGVVAS